jgi:hypothetical protein
MCEAMTQGINIEGGDCWSHLGFGQSLYTCSQIYLRIGVTLPMWILVSSLTYLVGISCHETRKKKKEKEKALPDSYVASLTSQHLEMANFLH